MSDPANAPRRPTYRFLDSDRASSGRMHSASDEVKLPQTVDVCDGVGAAAGTLAAAAGGALANGFVCVPLLDRMGNSAQAYGLPDACRNLVYRLSGEDGGAMESDEAEHLFPFLAPPLRASSSTSPLGSQRSMSASSSGSSGDAKSSSNRKTFLKMRRRGTTDSSVSSMQSSPRVSPSLSPALSRGPGALLYFLRWFFAKGETCADDLGPPPYTP